jgi:hypothetical protein
VLSYRSFSVLALALTTVVPVSLTLAGCSAAGGGSETKGNGSNLNGGGSSTSGGSGLNLGPTAGTLSIGGAGVGGAASADACGQVLPVVYRDFNGYGMPGGHDDFEASARGIHNKDGGIYMGWNDVGCGLVEPVLGADGKPVAYAGMPDKVEANPDVPAGTGRRRRQV